MTNETKLFIIFEILLLCISIQQLSIYFNDHKETIKYKEKEITDTVPTIRNKIIIEQKVETKEVFKKIEIEQSCIEEWRGNEDD